MNEVIERIPDYQEKNMEEKIILNIRDISATMQALYEGRSSQKRVLIILFENGDISQRELTSRLKIKPASVSELVSRIEENGLITRSPSKIDRRIQILSLTEIGREKAAALKDKRKDRHDEMFNCFSDKEKEDFLSYLEKLNIDWDKKYR